MSEAPAVEVPAHVVEFLRENKVTTLATASPSGVPHASTFLYVNEGPALFFWSRPTTTTARHIEQNPNVSFTIDDYSEDLTQTKGVQGRGECSVILDGTEVARVADLFGQKFPKLSPGNTMSISFFRITPTELEFIDNSATSEKSDSGAFGAEFHRERAYSLFDELPVTASALGNIGADLQVVEVPAGEVLMRQGGPADKFLVVIDGSLQVERDDDGRTETIDTLAKGRLFGELSILRDSPRAATVKALEDSKVFVIERDVFIDLVAQSLGTTAQLNELINARLRSTA
jgi:uncharacterized protein YhbP (UPF0306 family)